MVCAFVLWQFKKFSISLCEFRHLFALFNNPRLNLGWIYFKARPRHILIGGYPSKVKGWKQKFFFILRDDWEFVHGLSRELRVPRFPRLWSFVVYQVILCLSIFIFPFSFIFLTLCNIFRSALQCVTCPNPKNRGLTKSLAP